MILENKIQKEGYSHRAFSEVRTKVKAIVSSEKLPPRSLRKKGTKRLCRKTGAEYLYVLIPPNNEKYPARKSQQEANRFQPRPERTWYRPLSLGAKVYECSACGRVDLRWNK